MAGDPVDNSSIIFVKPDNNDNDPCAYIQYSKILESLPSRHKLDYMEKKITIVKIELKLLQKSYDKFDNVDTATFIFIQSLFASMKSSNYPVCNKISAIKIQIYIETNQVQQDPTRIYCQ